VVLWMLAHYGTCSAALLVPTQDAYELPQIHYHSM
jgi:hypothetical protein